MKKNYYVTKRLVSLALAVVLSSGSLFATAMAATVTVDMSNTPVPTNGIDVFHANVSTFTADGAATITGFNAAQDFVSVSNVPAGYSVVIAQDSTDTLVSVVDVVTPSITKKLFKLLGTTATVVKTKAPDAPVIFAIAGGNIDVDGSVARKNTFTLTPTVTLANGTMAAGATYSWAKNDGGVVGTNSVLTLDTSSMAVGDYNYSLTVTANGKTDTMAFKTITIKNVCSTPTFAGVNFNTMSPDTASVASNGIVHVPLTLAATANITTTNCTYDNHGTHGLSPEAATYTLTPTAGLSLNGATLTIDGNTLTGTTATITASIKVGNDTKTSSKDITITKTGVPLPTCSFDPTSINFTTSATTNTFDGDLVTSVDYFAGAMGGINGCAAHAGGDPYHGKTVGWTVTNETATGLPLGVSFTTTGNNMKLIIDKNKLASPKTVILVRAYVKEKPEVTTLPQRFEITKTGTCTKEIVAMSNVSAASQTSGSPIDNTGRFIINSATATAKMTSTPSYSTTTGICDFEASGTAHPTSHKHTVVWTRTGTNTNGITIDPVTGVLTVNYGQLTNIDAHITVTATANGKTGSGNIVIRRGTLPNTGGGNNDYDEQNKNSQQWDKLEYKIEDADSKDNIKMSMGDNTNMPTRVVRELVGKNVTVEISVTGGYTWILNGKNLKKPPTYQIGIGLGVETVKDKDATSLAKGNAIKVIELEHNGTFYGTYTLEQRVDTDYRNKYLYLYKYDDDANKLYYRGSAKVDSDGYVKFPFTSASTYVMTDKALYGEKAGSTVGGATSGTGSTGSSSGGASVVAPPASSVAPPVASSSSSSESSTSSSEASSEIELPSSSSEVSRPTDVEPDEPEDEPAKKSIPLIVPILLVVVTVTIIAVILLAKGGMNIGN